MKKKCVSCRHGRGIRDCPALDGMICSLCCGTKREKEILCPKDCKYLAEGKLYQMLKNVRQEVSQSFNREEEDIFQNDDNSVRFSTPLERFFLEHFYHNLEVNDTDIERALMKIYARETKQLETFSPENRCEELVFQAYARFDEKYSDIAAETKSQTILRILKSIDSSSGSILGNRNYLEMIYGQLEKKGKWAKLFYGND
jgi:hypothetical protein